MTLETFLSQEQVKAIHLEHPEFDTLYVRHAKRIIDGKLVETFDIATVTASNPGAGAFTRLIEHLTQLNLGKPVYVESVINERLQRWLLRNYFTPCGYDCFHKTLKPQGETS
jgi:hypothetical protein